MTTAVWWHCFSGIAGDMALGSLVDAGADVDEIRRQLVTLPVGGWSIEARPVLRAGLAATHLVVEVRDSPVVRTHSHIVGLINEASLPDRARRRALATFGRLAEVEGRLHRRPPTQVHFHEVGGIDEIHASPVAQGTGVVRAAHGLLPNPTPAVVELLRDAPTYGTDNPAELTTPTGAALLSALAIGWGPMPAMDIVTTGRGAGTRDNEGTPNLVQAVVGRRAERGAAGGDAGQDLVVLESNVDDVTGEVLAHVIDAALAAGANDAWVTPVVGKKGRPAHVISLVAEPLRVGDLRRLLVAETGTLGVRTSPVHRWAATRHFAEVTVAGHAVRVKRSAARVKAEYADTVAVAKATGLPVREVARRAEAAALEETPTADAGAGADPGAGAEDGGPVAGPSRQAPPTELHPHQHPHHHPHDGS
ncbi:MAG TPA: LarC family nickel insertion protein [Acidimicrobiales bacterium]|nr:LarC family nickel insertion protein [Acidimicrobiales bacterium]